MRAKPMPKAQPQRRVPSAPDRPGNRVAKTGQRPYVPLLKYK